MAKIDLTKYGITGTTEIVYNPSYEMLFEEETKPGLEGFEKGQVSELGAVNVMTGIYTGRSPKDKYIVMDENNKDVAMVSAYPGYFIGSSSDTKQKEACIRFLKYMLSEKVQTKIWKKTGQIPSNPNVNIADLSGQNDVIYEAYAKLKKADIVRELPGNDWDFEQREDFEANIFRYLSGDISEDEIVDSLKSK